MHEVILEKSSEGEARCNQYSIVGRMFLLERFDMNGIYWVCYTTRVQSMSCGNAVHSCHCLLHLKISQTKTSPQI